MEYTLARYDAAKRSIAECESVDEVKPWADKAAALAAYARQADDPELEAWARRIRLRATKRIGEISAGLETTGKPGPEGKIRSHRWERRLKSRGPPRSRHLKDCSVANRAEKLAAIPEDEFERAVEACPASIACG